MTDTSPEAAARQLAILRALSGEERLRLARQMSEMARGLAAARIQAEHPTWDGRQVLQELVRIAFLTEERTP